MFNHNKILVGFVWTHKSTSPFELTNTKFNSTHKRAIDDSASVCLFIYVLSKIHVVLPCVVYEKATSVRMDSSCVSPIAFSNRNLLRKDDESMGGTVISSLSTIRRPSLCLFHLCAYDPWISTDQQEGLWEASNFLSLPPNLFFNVVRQESINFAPSFAVQRKQSRPTKKIIIKLIFHKESLMIDTLSFFSFWLPFVASVAVLIPVGGSVCAAAVSSIMEGCEINPLNKQQLLFLMIATI